ncbi:MAG: hypothetical protein AAGI28_10855 [Pseudomonadota bacterium]
MKLIKPVLAALVCLTSTLMIAPGQAGAQEKATVFKSNRIPAGQPAEHALLWVRMAKHSDHRWKINANIGLGILVGSVKTERTEEKEPLKKPLWPTIQIAPFDIEANEFAGEGSSTKAFAKTLSRPVYIREKRFISEDADYRHYLVRVRPGTYVIGGTRSTCFCWGSKRFTVEAGEAYNLGTYYIATENGLSYWPDLAGFRTADDLTDRGLVTDTMRLGEPLATDEAPGALASFSFTPVEYEDAAFFGNYFGRLVNRILPEGWQPGDAFELDADANDRGMSSADVTE